MSDITLVMDREISSNLRSKTWSIKCQCGLAILHGFQTDTENFFPQQSQHLWKFSSPKMKRNSRNLNRSVQLHSPHPFILIWTLWSFITWRQVNERSVATVEIYSTFIQILSPHGFLHINCAQFSRTSFDNHCSLHNHIFLCQRRQENF